MSPMDQLAGKRIYPKNPLGIIALFVFLIEAISTVSLKFLLDAQSPFVGPIVVFIISLPSVIVILFFITLWLRRESLYSPADFREDASFVHLLAKVERLEVKQEATQLDPRGDDSNALDIIQKLMDKDEVQSAVSLGKAFLKVSRYASSLEIFRYIERRIPLHINFIQGYWLI